MPWTPAWGNSSTLVPPPESAIHIPPSSPCVPSLALSEASLAGNLSIPEGGGKKIYSVNEGNYRCSLGRLGHAHGARTVLPSWLPWHDLAVPSLWDDNIKSAVDGFKVRWRLNLSLLLELVKDCEHRGAKRCDDMADGHEAEPAHHFGWAQDVRR